jgi:hypothetical protein
MDIRSVGIDLGKTTFHFVALGKCGEVVLHRQKLVEIRTWVKNGLQHLALNQGVQKKGRRWSRAGLETLRALPLAPRACRRRQDLRDC